MENKETYTVGVKKLPQSRVEITLVIPSSLFDQTRKEALMNIGKDIELPGFRKGHVPEKILLTKIGEGSLLEEMAEISISRAYPEILRNEKIDALGRPEVTITKIAHGNPLECLITTAIFPEITLPNFKEIARKEKSPEENLNASDEEVTKATEELVRINARRSTENEGKVFDEKTALPPLDDALAKHLTGIETIVELKEKIKENILKEKERSNRDKKRVSIMESILKQTTVELPEIIIEQELHRMRDEFAQEINRMGMSLESYLSALKKTEDDLTKEWRPDAEKRAKVQLITSKIAEVEKINPKQEEVDMQVRDLMSHYPNASKERAQDYIFMLLSNEEVFRFLESQQSE